jgi:hypothetical protein
MEILLIGAADSIFFEHYCKNLKAQKPDINIDVFSVEPIMGQYDLSACNNIFASAWNKSFLKKIKGLRTIIKPFYSWFALYSFLIKNKKKYDIIHFKWLVPEVVLFPRLINKFCRKSIATFWGTEQKTQSIFYSNFIYRLCLRNFLQKKDAITYPSNEKYKEQLKIHSNHEKFHYAIYSSSIYSAIERLVATESKNKSKEYLSFDPEKITISIGYSGKKVHQHVKIINTLFRDSALVKHKDKLHFILPLNYGCDSSYIEEIKYLIKSYNANYKIITQKMTDFEIARLRNATDIMIQLSSSDALSASIIESLLTGAILISGKWLPYEVFKQKRLFFYELDNIDSTLPKLIIKLAEDIDVELKKCQNNKEKWGFETWGKVIKYWIEIYDKLLIEKNI